MRQVDVDDRRAGLFESLDGLTDELLDARLHATDEVLPRQAQAHALEPRRGLIVAVRQRRQVIRHSDRRGRRVALVAAGDDAQEQGRVAHVTRERPDLVERAGKGDDAVAADAAVRGLEPHGARQGGRLTDRATRVRSYGKWRLVGRHGRGRAAAAAAWDAVQVPRIGRGPVSTELGRRAHRELVHVRLARQYRARRVQPLGDVRVIRADVALEDGAPGSRGVAPGQHQVLERDRDAEQRRQRALCPVRARAGRPRRAPGSSARSRFHHTHACSAWSVQLDPIEVRSRSVRRS